MYQLLFINLLIVMMDVTLLTLEFLGFFITQTVLKYFSIRSNSRSKLLFCHAWLRLCDRILSKVHPAY